MNNPIIGQGRYEVLARLAAGGFKTVWRAYDRTLEQEVALAVLHDDGGWARAHAHTSSAKRPLQRRKNA